MKDYTSALICFKMMLKYSWLSNTPKIELAAYDGMAKCNYYLRDLNKSMFYNDRYNYARTEVDSSHYKTGYVKGYINKFTLKNKIKPKFVFIKDAIYKNEDSTFEYDFLYKYFEKHEINKDLNRDRKEIIKSINNIKKDSQDKTVDIEELDLKYSNKKFCSIRRATPIHKIQDITLPSPCRYGDRSQNNKLQTQNSERNKRMTRSYDLRVRTSRRLQSKEYSLSSSESRNQSLNSFGKKFESNSIHTYREINLNEIENTHSKSLDATSANGKRKLLKIYSTNEVDEINSTKELYERRQANAMRRLYLKKEDIDYLSKMKAKRSANK